MAAPRSLQFDTLSLHAGQRPDPVTGARATPIYFTTSFVFRDADHAAALFNMERGGHVYSRISNPTNAVLEERVAALEGGLAARGRDRSDAAFQRRHPLLEHRDRERPGRAAPRGGDDRRRRLA